MCRKWLFTPEGSQTAREYSSGKRLSARAGAARAGRTTTRPVVSAGDQEPPRPDYDGPALTCIS
ncbi:hypothetical protein PCASD_05530 [Puccinia coronata f. sp. avenae]|uniref:Uncharacterized protein n=1 Tax=Puccinia coronata f. sp. avenae TaxID=200324 RepID=A0A2N5SY53_9BASI|nr:hypothetical protein PCASD_19077 [Puccinia coronata f. sp. avenae]PLW41813.1 hypothetical protein PCASD_05530 [Puccinia coronata f. sp. avenae]